MPIQKLNDETITVDDITNFYKSLPSPGRTQGGQIRPYASQVGLCPLLSNIQGLMMPVTYSSSRAMDYYAGSGNSMEHSVVEEYLRKGCVYAMDYKIPQSFFNGFNIGGKIDLIYEIAGTPILVDIKNTGTVTTTNEITFTTEELKEIAFTMEQLQNLNDSEKSEGISLYDMIEQMDLVVNKKKFNPRNAAYIAQVQTYSAITGIDTCFLQYFSRKIQDEFKFGDDIPSTFSYNVDTSEEHLVRRMANIYYSLICRDNKVLGLKSSQIKKSHCAQLYCNFQEFCWNGGKVPVPYPVVSDKDHKLFWNESNMLAKSYIKQRPERFERFMKEMEHERRRIYEDIDYKKSSDTYQEYIKKTMTKRLKTEVKGK